MLISKGLVVLYKNQNYAITPEKNKEHITARKILQSAQN